MSNAKKENSKQLWLGFDVGYTSVGAAALEVDVDKDDCKILEAVSFLHDGAGDPTAAKVGSSRKKVAGAARRLRKFYAERHKRLTDLDKFLEETFLSSENFKANELDTDDVEPWELRSELAKETISDIRERNQKLVICLRHIARHRGWFNTWLKLDNLISKEYKPSKGWEVAAAKLKEVDANVETQDLTLAQLVVKYFDLTEKKNVRLRSKRDLNGKLVKSGFFSETILALDLIFEIRKICKTQEVDEKLTEKILKKIYQHNPPFTQANLDKTVGRDPINGEPRAHKATLEFQEYKIAATIAHLKSASLTKTQRYQLFNYLNFDYLEQKQGIKPTWQDVADFLGVEFEVLRESIADIDVDDPELVKTKNPPINNTIHAIFTNAKLKKLQKWWQNADTTQLQKTAFITIIAEKIGDGNADEELAKLFEQFDEKDFEALDKLKLPNDRAAYSTHTCKRLTWYMLEGNNLHEARKKFGEEIGKQIDDNWPPRESLETLTGIPIIDRNFKIISRFLKRIEAEYGVPQRITVEIAREGFLSVAKAKNRLEEVKTGGKIGQQRQKLIEIGEMPENSSKYDWNRYEAVERQNSECLYCGVVISKKNCEIDHIVPRSGPGSSNRKTNLAAVCRACNLAKGNEAPGTWIARNPRKGKVKMEAILKRIDNFNLDAMIASIDLKGKSKKRKELAKRITTDFKKNVQKLRFEPKLSGSALVSTATAGTILAKRLRNQYSSDTVINVVSGFVTYEAKLASYKIINNKYVDKNSSLFNLETYKIISSSNDNDVQLDKREAKRFDRRHHAIDALIVATIKPSVRQVLAERQVLREEANNITNGVNKSEISYEKKFQWLHYDGYDPKKKYGDPGRKNQYFRWRNLIRNLRNEINTKLREDKIEVKNPLRLRLQNSQVHEQTINKFTVVRKVGDEIPADLIDNASSPQLWCALTRHSDLEFDKNGLPVKKGLPENPTRKITLRGKTLTAEDRIYFFGEDNTENPVRAGLTVRNGWAILGSPHHMRLYLVDGKYELLIVNHVDLVAAIKSKKQGNIGIDLFTIPLPPQSIARRMASVALKKAFIKFEAGEQNALKYITWFTYSDEMIIDPTKYDFLKEPLKRIDKSALKYWYFSGVFRSDRRINLKPLRIAVEGIQDQGRIKDLKDPLQNFVKRAFGSNGWVMSVDAFFSPGVTIVRRDSLGRVRNESSKHLPCTVKIPSLSD